MVNNSNPFLKILPGILPPPSEDAADDDDRLIRKDEPLWDLDELVRIVGKDSKEKVTVRIETNDARSDYKDLQENGFNLHQVMLSIKGKGRFLGAFWCKTSPSKRRSGRRFPGAWVPCDSYAINNLDYVHPVTNYRGKANYYFKMCKGLDGSTVIFVSLHV